MSTLVSDKGPVQGQPDLRVHQVLRSCPAEVQDHGHLCRGSCLRAQLRGREGAGPESVVQRQGAEGGRGHHQEVEDCRTPPGAGSGSNVEMLKAFIQTFDLQESEYLALWLDCDREGENIGFEVK